MDSPFDQAHVSHRRRAVTREAEPRLIFPAQALELARRNTVRPSLAARQDKPAARDAFLTSVDDTLDYMQQRLNALKDDVEAITFRFPTDADTDTPPPRAA